MRHDYLDIAARIKEAPQWFDEHGVPRYCRFHPAEIANVYAQEAVLMEIACQRCGHLFPVAISQDDLERFNAKHTLAEMIGVRELHYGDPPNVACCDAGPTMNSEPRKVLEYWQTNKGEWTRNPELEVDIRPDWVLAGEPSHG